MFGYLARTFMAWLDRPRLRSGPPPIEKIAIGELIFKRQRHADPGGPYIGQAVTGPGVYLDSYDYWCPDCGTKLADGPTGGAAINAVCHQCRVNFGNLPGFWGTT